VIRPFGIYGLTVALGFVTSNITIIFIAAGLPSWALFMLARASNALVDVFSTVAKPPQPMLRLLCLIVWKSHSSWIRQIDRAIHNSGVLIMIAVVLILSHLNLKLHLEFN